MKLDCTNFYDEIEAFAAFPEKITNVTAEEFKKVFGCEAAEKSKEVVYVWRSERKIKILKGESDILYIGQTKQSFRDRYYKYAGMHATSKANSLKFKHIIDIYGAITISVAHFSKFADSLQKAEGQLLWWYFQNHCEYPPINYTQTKIRNDAFQLL
ncbi:hypothetical protein KP001_00155 [Geomonas subterranea]|uniref:GIY-YIG domain-containing protein n=1 Tax=Geomonas subterranea TaxID=2847989 RepID=A0ABX8LJY3_9BACT|nr:hypothetical protein [Geomonas subterranea]QXE91000.1 hypothetical protein KP001_00155 [Geomonas subterranea]QXM10914.1 hypothetical protein KP002_07325 [Geomonas subterranea]